MTHAITSLRRLLTGRPRTNGVVAAVQGNTVFVSTPSGTVQATADSMAGVSVGASVTLSDGRIVSVRGKDHDLPLFSV